MDVKISLSLDARILAKAEAYAKRNHISLKTLVENFMEDRDLTIPKSVVEATGDVVASLASNVFGGLIAPAAGTVVVGAMLIAACLFMRWLGSAAVRHAAESTETSEMR